MSRIASAYVAGWVRTFDYKGRSTRLEYLSFVLANGALEIGYLVGATAYVAAVGPPRSVVVGLVIVWLTIVIATGVPEVAIILRRLRDTGRTRWLILPFFIPIAGRLCRWWFMRQPTRPPISN